MMLEVETEVRPGRALYTQVILCLSDTSLTILRHCGSGFECRSPDLISFWKDCHESSENSMPHSFRCSLLVMKVIWIVVIEVVIREGRRDTWGKTEQIP